MPFGGGILVVASFVLWYVVMCCDVIWYDVMLVAR